MAGSPADAVGVGGGAGGCCPASAPSAPSVWEDEKDNLNIIMKTNEDDFI